MMTSGNKLILLALSLLVLSSLASANQPNITFTWNPTSPLANQDINFTVVDSNNTISDLNKVNWGFPDGNVISTRDTNTFTNVFFYDFNANNYTQAPAWTVGGSWDASTGLMVGSSSDAIAKNSFDYNNTDWNFHLTFNGTSGTVAAFIMIGGTISTTMGGGGSPQNFNGYLLDISPTRMLLKRFDNGAGTTLFTNTRIFNGSQTYVFDFNRTIDGVMTVAIDGNTGGYSSSDTTYLDMNELGMANATAGTTTYDNFILKGRVNGTRNVQTTVVHQLTTPGSNNVCVTVQDTNSLSSSTCNTVNVLGDVNITIYDENTISPFLGVTATLNGVNVSQLSNGSLDMNMLLLNGINSLTVTAPNKGNRTWSFYAISTSVFDYNLVMLDSNKGSDVAFIIADRNGTVYSDANVNVVIIKTGVNHGDYNVFDGTTDSSGMVTIFLNPNPSNDGNYVFFVNKTGSSALRYDDSNITISVPLDEALLFPLSPYQVTQGGLGGGTTSGLTASINYRILSNTVQAYTFTIDRNTDYYDRTYSITTQGGADFNLQPYLARVSSSSIIAFTIKQLSLPTLPIPNVLVQLKKTINGTITTLESQQSDVSGTVRFSMINADSYILNFYYLGNQICSFTTSNPCNAIVNTTFTQYNVLIDVNGSNDSNQVQLSSFVSFTPTSSSITSCFTCQVSLSQEVQSYYAKYITVKVTRSDGTILSSVTRTYTNSFTDDIFNESIDSNLISNIQWITVDVIVQGQNDENQTSSATYTINQTNSFLVNLRNMSNDVGAVPLLIFSIVITILITGSMGIFFRDSGLTVMMAAIILAFFTFGLGWVNPVGFFLACMSGFGAYLWYERLGV